MASHPTSRVKFVFHGNGSLRLFLKRMEIDSTFALV